MASPGSAGASKTEADQADEGEWRTYYCRLCSREASWPYWRRIGSETRWAPLRTVNLYEWRGNWWVAYCPGCWEAVGRYE